MLKMFMMGDYLLSLFVYTVLQAVCLSSNSFAPNDPAYYPSTTPSNYYNRQPYFPSSPSPFDYIDSTFEDSFDIPDYVGSMENPYLVTSTPNQQNIFYQNNGMNSFSSFNNINSVNIGGSGVTITQIHNRINFTEINAFYPEDEICCSGKAFPKLYGRCCGINSAIDTTRQVCCDGVVHDLKVGFACCGDQYFDVRQQICCNEEFLPSLQDLPLNSAAENEYVHFRCCSKTEIYDVRTHICCNKTAAGGQVLAKADSISCEPSNIFITTDKWDGDSSVMSSRFFCNNQQYNPNKQLCCGSGVIRKTNPRDSCCGDQLYDPQIEICCIDWNKPFQFVIHPKVQNENTACCGPNAFNSNLQFCCGGNKKGPFGKWPFYKGPYTIMDLPASIPKNRASCCSDKESTVTGVYDSGTQICCDGNIQENVNRRSSSCCGHDSMNTDTHFCCNGTAFPTSAVSVANARAMRNVLCCFDSNGQATGLFNSRNQKCCDGVIVNANYSEICCGQRLYNGRQGMCCGGVFIERNSNLRCCRGNIAYDPQTQICCRSTMQVLNKGKTDDNACCGSATYKIGAELCCESNGVGVVHQKMQQRDFCCGNAVIHDRNTEMCCRHVDPTTGRTESAIVDKAAGASCCGLSAFNRRDQTCCQGTVIPKGNRRSIRCCGNLGFDPNSEICCNGQIYSFPETIRFKRCCGSEPYDQRTEICCAGKVKEVDPGRISGCCVG